MGLYQIHNECKATDLINFRIPEYIEELDVDDSLRITQATTIEVERFVHDELSRHHHWQSKVLEFCVNQAVTPADIADEIERNDEAFPHFFLNLAHNIRKELSITCLVEAQRLLWR